MQFDRSNQVIVHSQLRFLFLCHTWNSECKYQPYTEVSWDPEDISKPFFS